MGNRETVTEQPRYIKLNDRDNVAIVVNDFGLPAGLALSLRPRAARLRAAGPQGRAGRHRRRRADPAAMAR